jgi:hypothetical protein
MTTTTIKFFKETAVPSVMQADSVYFIGATGSTVNELEVYVTSSAGTGKRVLNKADVQTLINASLAAVNELQIVNDIAARDALTPTVVKYVYVKNATGDSTVASGGATYLYDPVATAWVKISEAESMDISVTWGSVTGGPSSSVADIDDAVSKRHTHTNKAQLDLIGEDAGGNMTYDGSLPYTGWDSTNW